ncbi:bifunctional UDP-sugar hydrolase/5'-nucleotidase [Bacillus pacificus]|uniref:bifunctional metallophosphatase/5'-nucleotidase n=1 Tax=Bacillus pacificus TaxID=2026187 RepID=UPI002E1D55C3|nr:bifunctional UDP-sugar hydrolase/5'-nucleotidase [Bacillus pacificus]
MKEGVSKVKFIYTNDIHANIKNVPLLSSFIKSVKYSEETEGEKVIVLDAGDFLDDIVLECYSTNGLSMAQILSNIPYDAITLGNHDIGVSQLNNIAKLREALNIPLLGANLYSADNNSLLNGVNSSIIIELDSMKIGVIGISYNFSERLFKALGGNIRDWKVVLHEEIKKLKSQGIGFIVLLSHLGLPTDLKIPEEFPDINLIIGGHTHDLLEAPMKKKDTLILQAGEKLKHIGVLSVEIDNISGKTLKFENKVILTEELDADYFTLENIRNIQIQLTESLAYELGYCNSDDPSKEGCAHLIAKLMKQKTNVDIGMMNTGFLFTSLSTGEIKDQHLWDMLPYALQPTVINVRGEHLKEAIELFLTQEVQNRRITDYEHKLGTMCFAGLKVVYDSSRDDGSKVINLELDKGDWDDNKKYSIVSNDFIAFGHPKLFPLRNSSEPVLEPYTIRDLLKEYIVKTRHLTLNTDYSTCKLENI